ncbi:MAG: hypothetical protein F9B45_15720 [Phycisphaera sp. RhM]|nr:hypothetical protein [Phycisphaera sp. RhM]
MMTHLRDSKAILFPSVATVVLVVVLLCGQTSADHTASQAVELGPGSAHPGTTGEVRVELEEFFLEGDPHACGIIWDVTVDEKKGELFVLCEPKRVGGVGEVRVFDRSGASKRTIMPLKLRRTGATAGGVLTEASERIFFVHGVGPAEAGCSDHVGISLWRRM